LLGLPIKFSSTAQASKEVRNFSKIINELAKMFEGESRWREAVEIDRVQHQA
jgi:hypothetical protein